MVTRPRGRKGRGDADNLSERGATGRGIDLDGGRTTLGPPRGTSSDVVHAGGMGEREGGAVSQGGKRTRTEKAANDAICESWNAVRSSSYITRFAQPAFFGTASSDSELLPLDDVLIHFSKYLHSLPQSQGTVESLAHRPHSAV